MDAPLAAALEAEVLHRIRDVDLVARDACSVNRLGEQAPGGADEGLSLEILLVAGLLAHEHEARAGASLREDDLRGILPELAAPAIGSGPSQLVDVPGWRDPLLGTGAFRLLDHVERVGVVPAAR